MEDLLCPITPEDEALIEVAKAKIEERYRERWHHLAAALRTKEGKVYTGVHVDAYVSALAVCAEQVAIGTALTHADLEIDTIVAVRKPRPGQGDEASTDLTPVPVTPCGRCRELICDYGRNAWVIVSHEGQILKIKAKDMLPEKYYLSGVSKQK